MASSVPLRMPSSGRCSYDWSARWPGRQMVVWPTSVVPPISKCSRARRSLSFVSRTQAEEMRLTKYTHATIVLEKDGASLVIDPGVYTPQAADLVGASAGVLITHDHPDHMAHQVVVDALEARSELRVWAPTTVASALGSHDGRVVGVAAGDTFEVGGFTVRVFGGHHATVHADIPVSDNVGYLVDGEVFHPGDSYDVPEAAVGTLLVPTGGPWARIGDAVDFIRAVGPTRSVQIHELPLSDLGRNASVQIASGLTGMPLMSLSDGETISV
jgi:L-ascorbate metabolism protein UlaG (beta-lactamase superfamily)